MEIGCLKWFETQLDIENKFMVYDIEDFLLYIHNKYSNNKEVEAPKYKDLVTEGLKEGKCLSHSHLVSYLHCALLDARMAALSTRLLSVKYKIIEDFKITWKPVNVLIEENNDEHVVDEENWISWSKEDTNDWNEDNNVFVGWDNY